MAANIQYSRHWRYEGQYERTSIVKGAIVQ